MSTKRRTVRTLTRNRSATSRYVSSCVSGTGCAALLRCAFTSCSVPVFFSFSAPHIRVTTGSRSMARAATVAGTASSGAFSDRVIASSTPLQLSVVPSRVPWEAPFGLPAPGNERKSRYEQRAAFRPERFFPDSPDSRLLPVPTKRVPPPEPLCGEHRRRTLGRCVPRNGKWPRPRVLCRIPRKWKL